MFAVISICLIVGYLLVTVAVPYRFESRAQKLLALGRERLVERFLEATIERLSDRSVLRWTRAWGTTSAVLFLLFGVLDGAFIRDDPISVARLLCFIALSAGLSAFLVLTCFLYTTLLTRLRSLATLYECGIRGAWVLGAKHASDGLLDSIDRVLADADHIGVVDITAYDLFADGGLLGDALARRPQLPVSVLLLRPAAASRDPETVQATVFQTVLRDLDLTAQTYERRLLATVSAIRQLNASRPENGKIEIAYYDEKPTFQGIFASGTALVAPCAFRQGDRFYVQLSEAADGKTQTCFEIFRRQFCRMWAAADTQRSLPPSHGSIAVRREISQRALGTAPRAARARPAMISVGAATRA